MTVLIGENNVGKSTVLEAIRLILSRGLNSRRGGQLFSEYDFYLEDALATPQTANPIMIILHEVKLRNAVEKKTGDLLEKGMHPYLIH